MNIYIYIYAYTHTTTTLLRVAWCVSLWLPIGHYVYTAMLRKARWNGIHLRDNFVDRDHSEANLCTVSADRDCQLQELLNIIELCVSSLRRGHANIICIVPSLTDDPRRESKTEIVDCINSYVCSQRGVGDGV